MRGNSAELTPLIMLLLKLLAVVGALGTVGLRPVREPPDDEVTEVHHPGVPVALFRKKKYSATLPVAAAFIVIPVKVRK